MPFVGPGAEAHHAEAAGDAAVCNAMLLPAFDERYGHKAPYLVLPVGGDLQAASHHRRAAKAHGEHQGRTGAMKFKVLHPQPQSRWESHVSAEAAAQSLSLSPSPHFLSLALSLSVSPSLPPSLPPSLSLSLTLSLPPSLFPRSLFLSFCLSVFHSFVRSFFLSFFFFLSLSLSPSLSLSRSFSPSLSLSRSLSVCRLFC